MEDPDQGVGDLFLPPVEAGDLLGGIVLPIGLHSLGQLGHDEHTVAVEVVLVEPLHLGEPGLVEVLHGVQHGDEGRCVALEGIPAALLDEAVLGLAEHSRGLLRVGFGGGGGGCRFGEAA